MSDWYGKSYEREAMDRLFEASPMSSARPREYDVVALIDFLVDREGRETRYYGC